LPIVQVDPEGDDEDESGGDISVTQDNVRALVTQMVKDYTCSTDFQGPHRTHPHTVIARVLMTVTRFQREKEEDIEETPDS
jgi:hypothetical protein